MKKKNDLIWGISLIIIGISTIISAGSNIIGIELPDVMVRITGIVELLSLALLIFTSVRKFKKN